MLTKTSLFDQLNPIATPSKPNLSNISSSAQLNSSGDKSSIILSFIPKHSRACNVVSFSPTNSNLLLCGLDKVRSDFCLNVYDVERALSQTTETSEHQNVESYSLQTSQSSLLDHRRISSSESLDRLTTTRQKSISSDISFRIQGLNDVAYTNVFPAEISKRDDNVPLYSLGLSESVNSADWLCNGTTIVAGMGLRFIRVYDLRGNFRALDPYKRRFQCELELLIFH